MTTTSLATSLATDTQPDWAKTTVAFNPFTRKYEVTPVNRGGQEMYIDPVTNKYVSPIDYRFTANTPEAIQYRANNAPLMNLITNTGLDYRAANNIFDTVKTYFDPKDSKDYTAELKNYLGEQLKKQGITDFSQVEKRTVGGKNKYYNTTTGKEINQVLFDDKAGTKYTLTDQGVQRQYSPDARVTAQAAQYLDRNSSGDAWNYHGTTTMLNQIGARIINATGVSDINDLELKTVNQPREIIVISDSFGNFYIPKTGKYLTDKEKETIKTFQNYSGDGLIETVYTAKATLPVQGIYNKKTGHLLAEENLSSFNSLAYGGGKPTISLGGWGEGEGMTYANLTFDANGKPVIRTWGKNTSDLGKILPAISLLTLPFGGIGGILSSITGTAGVGGLAGAALGELGMQTAGSGVAGALANAGLSETLANISANALVSGAAQSGIASLTGQDVGKAFTSGALTGGLNASGAPAVKALTDAGLPSYVAQPIVASTFGGIGAELRGGDFGTGALSAGASNLVGQGVKSLDLGIPKPFESALTQLGTAAILGKDVDLGQLTQNAIINHALGQVKGALKSSGTSTPDTTVGATGADSIYGAGADSIYGAGADSIFGADGNDIVESPAFDYVSGGTEGQAPFDWSNLGTDSGGGGMSDFDYVFGGDFTSAEAETAGTNRTDWGGDFTSAEAETAGTNRTDSTVAKDLGLTSDQVKALLKSSFGSASDPLAKSGLANLLSPLDKALRDSLGIGLGDAAKYGLLAGIAKMAYDSAKKAREEAKGTPFKSSAPYQAVTGPGGVTGFKKAAMGGGIGSLDLAWGGRALPPRYLDGHSDGMADKVPAHIDNRRPAALSDGEFVIPADVVSHLGNGNSNAGAKRLYKMMDNIRAARTGNPKQGKQINPDKFLPR